MPKKNKKKKKTDSGKADINPVTPVFGAGSFRISAPIYTGEKKVNSVADNEASGAE